MNGDWYVDPLGRFDGRFFDGEVWTDQVSDGGMLRTDPYGPPRTRTPASANAQPKGAVGTQRITGRERRSDVDRRGEELPVAYEQRSGERRQLDAIIVSE